MTAPDSAKTQAITPTFLFELYIQTIKYIVTPNIKDSNPCLAFDK